MKTNTTTTHPSLRSEGWTDAQVRDWIDAYVLPFVCVVLVLGILRRLAA